MEKYFGLSEKGTTVKIEVIAGITTFVTMAYIFVVNPSLLSSTAGEQYYNPIFIATCLSAFAGTLLMGLYAKIPFAQASGMGLNAFCAFTVIPALGYKGAMAVVFISGILFILLSLLGAREAIVNGIPHSIKIANSVGIGLYIAFIGMQNAGIIIDNKSTLVGFASFRIGQVDTEALLALIGLFIIAILYRRNVKGSVLLGIFLTALLGIPMGVTKLPETMQLFAVPDFQEFFTMSFLKMDFSSLFGNGGFSWEQVSNFLIMMLAFTMVDMFDTIGCLVGTAQKAGLLDKKGHFPQMKKALVCDAAATTVGACCGTSTVTTYIESGAGITAGGKTGLTSVITAGFMLLTLFFLPVIQIIPSAATAPALIFVGIQMLGNIRELDFDDISELLPAFMTIVMIPFTYSVATGIGIGIISYVVLKVFGGKWREIPVVTGVIAVLFLIRFALVV